MLKVELVMRVRGITQKRLAEIVGCHRVNINRIVRGRENPSRTRMEAIAAALDYPASCASELFEEVEV